jgi:hypothetical protein
VFVRLERHVRHLMRELIVVLFLLMLSEIDLQVSEQLSQLRVLVEVDLL